ncbi:MAG TPA: hypothetical protein VFJ74_17900 [Gemmatimonadaceae bacterium]|nr:hypothetical protein [Gemmatimonadaceae bacterium]
MTGRALVRVAAALVALAAAPSLRAQVAPDEQWRTIRTAHFAVHFTPPLEEAARRTAANAERAYAELSRELVPPRGVVDVVVADNVDFTNGYATVFPSNRIVVYAHPPVDVQALRYYDDWSSLVITHELTHIFHLDRSRGWWAAAQRVFGRNPVLFPNLYEPSWITEGLAVYYESHLTGYGRIAGSEHRMIARAAALGDAVPRLDQLSLGTPRFPQGDVAYGYGSLIMSYLARTRGPESMRRFVERTAVTPLPFFLDRAARNSFGVSFSQAWRQWRDSLAVEARAADAGGRAPEGWRPLTSAGWYELFPRWIDSSSLVYAANPGRSVTGAYTVAADGSSRPRRLGRRSAVDANAPRGGEVVYAQLDYTSPYVLRSDLYAQRLERGAPERRLTHGARLSAPDVRARDGAIVAVQATPATTRLVLLDPAGRNLRALTTTSADTQWSEPRWSPAGARVAAVRRSRDGASAIVLLDTLGRVSRVAAASHAVDGAPAWSPDGATLYFTSDRTGSTQLYAVSLGDSTAAGDTAAAVPAARRVTNVATGIFYPAPSPDGRRLAASLYRADGYEIGVAPIDTGRVFAESANDPAASAAGQDRLAEGPARADGATRRYSPWRTLAPRYWVPVFGRTDEQRLALGAYTSGADVVGRHSYAAQVTAPVSGGSAEPAVYGAYRYSGLGVPVLDAVIDQSWDHFALANSADERVGTLSRRSRTTLLAATVFRPRARSYASLSVGGSIEDRRYGTTPDTLLALLPALYSSTLRYPSLFASGSWSHVQYPSLAISPEDGVAFGASVRERWRQGGGSGSRSTTSIGVARGYKSLDLSGYAHHVVAVQLAGGVASAGATDAFEAGGVSGASLELVPGVVVGSSQRTFGVRGFPVAATRGVRARGGSVELRAPLTMPGRGLGIVPVFLSRTLVTGFVDQAEAWCPSSIASNTPACIGADTVATRIASAGLELGADAALQYDAPYRFRLGVATPIAGRALFGRNRVSVYATLGVEF